MKNLRAKKWGRALGLVALTGCATRPVEEVTGEARANNRAPAAVAETSAPYAAPARQPDLPYAASRAHQQAPNNSAPAPVGPNGERLTMAQAEFGACLQTPVGDRFTVADLLSIAWYEAPRARYPLSPGQMPPYASFSGDYNVDREILRPWFGGVGETNLGSDLWEAAQDSEPFSRALRFVVGYASGSKGLTYRDYFINARLAALVAAMTATAQKKECVKGIAAQAPRLLCDPQDLRLKKTCPLAQKVMELPFYAAASSVEDGSLTKNFDEVKKSRKDIKKDIDKLERQTLAALRKNSSALREVQRDIQDDYRDRRKDIAEIRPCLSLVQSSRWARLDPTEDPEEKIRALRDECREKIEDRIDRYKDELDRLHDRSRRLVERAGKVSPTEETSVNDRLRAVEVQLEEYGDFLSMINQDEPLDRVEALTRRRENLLEQADVKGLRAQQEGKRQDRAKLSERYLSYGLVGGFGFSTPNKR